jgi:thioredoxin reductase (NADPH)
MIIYDLIIVGGGAAGLSAGIYSARYKLKTLIVQGDEPGGDTAIAALVENYPGFESIDGFELTQKMENHAKNTGVEFAQGEVSIVQNQSHCFILKIGENTYQSKTIILANGSERRRLGLSNEKELVGKGVAYCTTCDSPVFKDKIVGIVGGGDASIKGANLAASYAKHLYLIAKGDSLIAEPVNLARFNELKNTTVLYGTEVKEIVGKDRLEKVILSKAINGNVDLKLDGLFIEIGAMPNNNLAKDLGVKLDERGYIDVDKFMQTSVDGIFAAGDISNASGYFKQTIMAAAQGAMAATSAYKDVGIHGKNLCELHAKAYE